MTSRAAPLVGWDGCDYYSDLHFGKTEIFLFWGLATAGKSGIALVQAYVDRDDDSKIGHPTLVVVIKAERERYNANSYRRSGAIKIVLWMLHKKGFRP